MTFEELLVEFRALGGVAENVRLGTGRYGRGVFVVDASIPARLHAPESLLVPVETLELRDGRLVVGPTSTMGARERAFFETLQEHFGWSGGGREEAWNAQTDWSRVPTALAERIQGMGMQQDLAGRFLAPSEENVAQLYVRERHIVYNERMHMMPLIDLVNHSSAANSYVFENGIGVAGAFEGEMLVRYNIGDAWTRALGHGFAERALHAYSIGIVLDIFGHRISIGREIKDSEVRDGIVYPRVRIEGAIIEVPYLTLGLLRAPTLPRAIFRAVVTSKLTSEQADETFDNIAHFNRMQLLNVLRMLEVSAGPVCTMLREAAIMQLEAISHCIGARLG